MRYAGKPSVTPIALWRIYQRIDIQEESMATGMAGRTRRFAIGAMIDTCQKSISMIGSVKTVAEKVALNDSLMPNLSGTNEDLSFMKEPVVRSHSMARNDSWKLIS